MSVDNNKPYVLRVAELIYSKVTKIKKENPEMSNIQAFEVFMTTKDYDLISSGEFHDKWFLELKFNNYVDKITGKKINDETMRLLEIQKDSMATPGLIRAKGPILQSLEILHPSRYENALTLQPVPIVTPGPNMTFGSMTVSWPRLVSNEKKTVSGATR